MYPASRHRISRSHLEMVFAATRIKWQLKVFCDALFPDHPSIITMLKGKTQVKFVCVYPWQLTVTSFSRSVSTHIWIKMRSWKERWREREGGKAAVNPPQRQCLCTCVSEESPRRAGDLGTGAFLFQPQFPVTGTQNRTPWVTCTQGWLEKFVSLPPPILCVSLPS